MTCGHDGGGGARAPSLTSLLQNIERKHQPLPNAARPARDLPEQAHRRLEHIPLARLTDRNSNARTHSPKQVRQIAASIKRFGFTAPVLVNAQNEILAGHVRVAAAKLLGLTEVPVLRLNHLSAVDQRAYVLADNRLAELAGWDHDTLTAELQTLVELDFAIEVTGFEVGEINLSRDGENEERIEDASTAAELSKANSGPPITRPGDVWLLGVHRFACGEDRDANHAGVDAAIRSWQRFTGKVATLSDTGQSFNQIGKQRRKAGAHRGRSRGAKTAETA